MSVDTPINRAGARPCSVQLARSPLSLGYEPYDARLGHLGRPLVTTLTSTNLRHEVLLSLLRLPRSSAGPAASGLQIGLRNRRLICSSRTNSASCRPWTRGAVYRITKRLP